MHSNNLTHELERIAQARHHDPFSVLGKHREEDLDLVRAYLPQADEVTIAEGNVPLERIPDTDLFEWRGTPGTVPDRYHLVWRDAETGYIPTDPRGLEAARLALSAKVEPRLLEDVDDLFEQERL